MLAYQSYMDYDSISIMQESDQNKRGGGGGGGGPLDGYHMISLHIHDIYIL